MSRVHADVVVVGGELCGLAAGALLALAGKKVLVVDDGDHVARSLGDRTLPLAPSFWKLPASGPAAGLFDALALKADARRLLGEPWGLGLVDDPDLRCVLSANADALLKEMTRAFGAGGRAVVDAFDAIDVERRNPALLELAHLHEDGFFFEARKAAGRVRALGAVSDVDVDDVTVAALAATPVGAALPQLAPFVQHREKAPAKGLAGVLAASAVDGGVSPGGPLGPRAVLRELFIGFIAKHKGDVIDARVDSVVVDGSRITLLRTTSKTIAEIAPSAVIDATAARDFVDRLPAGRARDKVQAQQGRVVKTAHATSVRWVLPTRVLPRGLPPSFLMLDETRPPVLVGLYMGVPSSDRSHVDEQLIGVVATAFAADSADLDARLAHVLPFARKEARHTDVVDASALHTHFVVKDSEHALVGRRPRTAVKNLARAGRDLAPAFGTDGELVAARSVVAVVESALPKVK